MEVPVIIEPITGSGYRATGAGGLSVGLSADGATAAEAIDRLADQVQLRVNAGARLEELNVAGGPAPWKQDAGYLHDDPIYQPWRSRWMITVVNAMKTPTRYERVRSRYRPSGSLLPWRPDRRSEGRLAATHRAGDLPPISRTPRKSFRRLNAVSGSTAAVFAVRRPCATQLRYLRT